MLRVWQKRLLDNKPIIEHEFTAGTHTFELPSGQYEIVLIGSGGISDYKREAVVSRPVVQWRAFLAQGGVGGTVIARLNISGNPTITVHVGDSSEKDTYITGINGFVLRAGGGTNANVTSTSSGTAGVMGTNQASGSFLSIVNNPETLVSNTYYYDKIATVPTQLLNKANTNYQPDTSKGSASRTASNGYVLIRSL